MLYYTYCIAIDIVFLNNITVTQNHLNVLKVLIIFMNALILLYTYNIIWDVSVKFMWIWAYKYALCLVLPFCKQSLVRFLLTRSHKFIKKYSSYKVTNTSAATLINFYPILLQTRTPGITFESFTHYVWTPLFKKDGYYNIFIENHVWK